MKRLVASDLFECVVVSAAWEVIYYVAALHIARLLEGSGWL